MELTINEVIEAKKFSIIKALEIEVMNRDTSSGKPIRIDLSKPTSNYDADKFMNNMRTQGIIPLNAEQYSVIRNVLDDANKIYNWITE